MKKIYSWIIFFLLLLLCAVKSNAQCQSSGSRNGSLFTSVVTSGVGSWNNPSNVSTSNGVPASLSTFVPNGDIESSNSLYVQNFGFNIPANAAICGITVKIERRQQGADGVNTFVKDNSVYLLKNSVITGNNRAYPWNWSSFYANTVHGTTSDNWGTTLTAADINSPNFGVAINVNMQSNCCDQTLYADIDHVSLTVFYTIPLPVQITGIDVNSPDNKTVNIKWSTHSENNNAGFSIERSTDAYNWEEVKFVAGAGNSNSVIDYSVTDENPYMGISYYRIKQIDINGVSEYYDMQSVEITHDISIKYNGEFIDIAGTNDNESHITILDCSGKSVMAPTRSNNDQRISIETKDLLPGIYIIIVETQTGKKVQKFFI